MTIQLSELWDYGKPELSEQRFRAALADASGDEAIILQSQIARTYGLRRDFSQAQEILTGIEPQIPNASLEAQARYYLELGRTYCSAAHPAKLHTFKAKALARPAYLRAFELAKAGNLDDLAIDALHMMTFVDTAPAEQLKWNRKAVALMQASTQPEARKWEAPLHNNTGYALHLLGRYEEAYDQFRLALTARERDGDRRSIRIAHWMIAWALRAMGRMEEALEIQLRLEKEWDADGEPDPYVFEELEHLYRVRNDNARADHYAALRKAAL